MGSKSEYDKFKRLFSDDEAKLPPGFDWEQMEDGIMGKMDHLESKAPPSSRQSWIIIAALALVVSIIPASNLLNYATNGNGKVAVQHGKAENGTGHAPGLPASKPLAAQPPHDEARKGQTKRNNEGQPSPATSAPLPSSGEHGGVRPNTVRGLPQASNLAGQQQRATAASSSMPKLQHIAAPEASGLQTPATSSLALENSKNASLSPSQGQRKAIPPPLPTLPAKAIALVAPPEAAMRMVPANAPIKAQQTASLPSRQLALISGVSNWGMGYGAGQPERQPYEQALLSYHAQLRYTHRFGNGLTLTMGLQYQQLETQLDWSKQLDGYTIILKDTIVEIHGNSLTGQLSEVRGDVEIGVEATRNVRHFNQYRLYQIPLAAGKSWRLGGRWHTDLSVGAAVNIYAHNQGRNVLLGELEDFNGPATPFLDSRWNVHGLAVARFGYRINERWGVLAEASLQKSLTNWSTEANVQMQPEIINLGIGLYYAL